MQGRELLGLVVYKGGGCWGQLLLCPWDWVGEQEEGGEGFRGALGCISPPSVRVLLLILKLFQIERNQLLFYALGSCSEDIHSCFYKKRESVLRRQ